jgi:F420-dependent oxidoreductase-like protein
MRVCVMVEGQEGVSWEQWLAIARATEEAGLDGLFRSDHYMSFGHPKEREVHDAWATLTALGTMTRRIKLGTMVSPATFRHPSNLAKAVVTADHASGGRVELGLGAGWNEAEHKAYGFPFPSTGERMEVFAEQAEIIHRSWNPGPFDFKGKHYTIVDLEALPKPFHQPHPNFIVGGQGGPKSVAVAARWADEYNVNFSNAATCAQRKRAVDEACEKAGRPALTFSLMTGCITGSDVKDLHARASRLMAARGVDGDPGEWLGSLPDVFIRGTIDEVAEQLGALENVGVERVMMQMQDHADVEMIHVLGRLAQQVG